MEELNLSEAFKWLQAGDMKRLALKHGLNSSAASKIKRGLYKRPHVGFLTDVLNEALKNKRVLVEKQRALNNMNLNNA